MWIVQNIPLTGSGLLLGYNSPNWLTFNSNDASVTFEVPQVDRRRLKTIMCIVYSSSAENTMAEGFKVVLIFGRLFFAIPSFARTVLTLRPFWFCLAGIMVWSSHRRSEKRRRDNPILREVASTSSQGFNDPKSLDKNPSVDLQELKRKG
ncbi:hypothetical protein TSUD_266290 [Trifolium subterraneum]|uniref:Uncharacterized protein n=1 Tax=Trifolium subterraneum TaxID=3900 RepID=A0A2Z6NPM7_TRISU|nr:hypothetical protein TSUD_266290 [Trifolium subterraneum]